MPQTGCPGPGKVLEVSGGGGGKAAGGANILGWCLRGQDCKAAGKLCLAARGEEKLGAATVAAPSGGGWCARCKEVAGWLCGLLPGVLLLLCGRRTETGIRSSVPVNNHPPMSLQLHLLYYFSPSVILISKSCITHLC